jgi:hypothetical protein
VHKIVHPVTIQLSSSAVAAAAAGQSIKTAVEDPLRLGHKVPSGAARAFDGAEEEQEPTDAAAAIVNKMVRMRATKRCRICRHLAKDKITAGKLTKVSRTLILDPD